MVEFHPFIARTLLSDADCDLVRRAMDAGDAQAAEVLDQAIQVDGFARRASEIDIAPDAIARVETRLDQAREAIERFFGVALTGREGPGFLRYESGGFYGPHRDRASLPSWPDASRRQIAAVLFLNDARDRGKAGDFAGGSLHLFPDDDLDHPIVIVPQHGMLVAFPATMLHEVTPVIDGRRDAVVDWYYGNDERPMTNDQ